MCEIDLKQRLAFLIHKQFCLRIRIINRQPTQTHLLKRVRKQIARVQTMLQENMKKNTRILKGHVLTNKMHKSIVVSVTQRIQHPVYKKFITRTTKLQAHDEHNQSQVGDLVQIRECRPISKRKSWKLVKILNR